MGYKGPAVGSLCPECLAVIEAAIEKRDGRVLIRKKCKTHGQFEDLYYGDAKTYDRFAGMAHEGRGICNPGTKNQQCPKSCGLCEQHKSTTILGLVDVTNRCNQKCPICFSNAAASGYLYEPEKERIKEMLQRLREEKPAGCSSVMFAGGEPTMREDLPELVSMAMGMGFSNTLLATNGVKLANSTEYVRELKAAGLTIVYLQFDGLRESTYLATRGYNALPVKLKAIENCRSAGLKNVTLVPTVAKGINEDQLGEIVRFGAENNDTVRGVNFQPLSFTGRVDRKKLKEQRITQPDIAKLLEEQTNGEVNADDFYPVPSVAPIIEFVEIWNGIKLPEMTCHPHCGCATYIFSDGDKMVPVTRFVDVEGLLELIEEVNGKAEEWGKLWKVRASASIAAKVPGLVDRQKAPKGINMIKLLAGFFRGEEEANLEFHRRSLFVSSMHFMDPYNFDCERAKRCIVHYSTPDGKIIPFCTYNSIHRQATEKKYSKSLKEMQIIPGGI